MNVVFHSLLPPPPPPPPAFSHNGHLWDSDRYGIYEYSRHYSISSVWSLRMQERRSVKTRTNPAMSCSPGAGCCMNSRWSCWRVISGSMNWFGRIKRGTDGWRPVTRPPVSTPLSWPARCNSPRKSSGKLLRECDRSIDSAYYMNLYFFCVCGFFMPGMKQKVQGLDCTHFPLLYQALLSGFPLVAKVKSAELVRSRNAPISSQPQFRLRLYFNTASFMQLTLISLLFIYLYIGLRQFSPKYPQMY